MCECVHTAGGGLWLCEVCEPMWEEWESTRHLIAAVVDAAREISEKLGDDYVFERLVRALDALEGKECHICKQPNDKPGLGFCSAPHGQLYADHGECPHGLPANECADCKGEVDK